MITSFFSAWPAFHTQLDSGDDRILAIYTSQLGVYIVTSPIIDLASFSANKATLSLTLDLKLLVMYSVELGWKSKLSWRFILPNMESYYLQDTVLRKSTEKIPIPIPQTVRYCYMHIYKRPSRSFSAVRDFLSLIYLPSLYEMVSVPAGLHYASSFLYFSIIPKHVMTGICKVRPAVSPIPDDRSFNLQKAIIPPTWDYAVGPIIAFGTHSSLIKWMGHEISYLI